MSDSVNGLGRSVDPSSARSSGTASNPERSGGAARTGGTGGESTSATGTGQDSVNLTDTARQLQALSRTASAAETVDSNQVEAIRQALADGQYSVDSRQIAERLLQFDN